MIKVKIINTVKLNFCNNFNNIFFQWIFELISNSDGPLTQWPRFGILFEVTKMTGMVTYSFNKNADFWLIFWSRKKELSEKRVAVFDFNNNAVFGLVYFSKVILTNRGRSNRQLTTSVTHRSSVNVPNKRTQKFRFVSYMNRRFRIACNLIALHNFPRRQTCRAN